MTSPVKRLALITRYDPFRTLQGTEIYVKNLAMTLATSGYDVHLIFGSTPPRLFQSNAQLTSPNIHIHLVTRRTHLVMREAEYLFKTRFLLRHLLSEIAPDVVVGIGAGQGSIFREIGPDSEKPLRVYYAVDCMAQEGRAVANLLKTEGASLPARAFSRARYLWLKRMDKRSCENAEFIVSTSYDTKRKLNSYYGVPLNKIAVNYLGIPDDYVRGFPCSSPEVPTFLHVVTRHDRKGTRYLLEALRILQNTSSRSVRVIISGPPDPRYIALSSGLGVTFVPPCDVRLLYSSCTALVVPSVAEGFCLPVVEAAAFGKPAIVSSAGSLPELVLDAETGYVVPVGNSEMLARRMGELSERPDLLEKMGSRALEISRKFSITRSTGNLLRILEMDG